MDEVKCKLRYVQLCRSLSTYGITYFDVKEQTEKDSKDSKKGKQQDIKVGITRDAILRVDPITKEVLSKWPLKQIKRWAATKNTFTLDVGDYSNDYICFISKDSERMAELLSGYIDIILKRRRGDSLKLICNGSRCWKVV